MIIWLFVIVGLFVLSGLMFGAPYLPTLKVQINYALELANLKQGETLLELGCGDGRVLLAAARKGIKCIGYEYNPLLVLIAKIRTRKYRSLVTVKLANYWKIELPAADAVFVFLIGRYMSRLDKLLKGYQYKPVKLVSFAFKVPKKSITGEKGGVYLYDYK